MLTAIAIGSFELRVCATSQVLSPRRRDQLDHQLIQLMNQYGGQWQRYPNSLFSTGAIGVDIMQECSCIHHPYIMLLYSFFRSIHQFFFPVDLEEDLRAILPSLVELAQTMYRFEYVLGAIERSHARYLDLHCYTKDEAEYDVYWSSAEALTQTQSSAESCYIPSSYSSVE